MSEIDQHVVESQLTESVKAALTDDVRPQDRPRQEGTHELRGHCYVAAQALYFLLGGKEAGYEFRRLVHEDVSHFFVRSPSGANLDPTAEQFKTPIPYDNSKRSGLWGKPRVATVVVVCRVLRQPTNATL